MNNRILLLLIIFSFLGKVSAQESEENKAAYLPCLVGNYFTLEAGAGFSGIKYDLRQEGKTDINFLGFDVKAGLRHYFAPHFGAGIGLRVQSYTGLATMNYVQSQSGALDFYQTPRSYEYRTYYVDYEEKQKAMLLEIPVEFFFQTNISGRWKFNLGLGLQGNLLALNKKYENSGGNISNRAYYKEWNLELPDIERYRLYDTSGFKGDYDYKPTISVIGEAGLLYALNSRLELAFNFHGTYNFTKALDSYSSRYLYDPDCVSEDGSRANYDGFYNGLLNTQAKDTRFLSLSFTVGIRYRFAKQEPQVALDFDDALHKARRIKGIEDEELNLTDSLDADEIVRRRRQQQIDSIDLADKERKRRAIEDEDFYISDNGDTIWKQKPQIKDSVQIVENVDSAKVIVDTAKVVVDNSQIINELKDILSTLNKNSCDFNQQVAANIAQQKNSFDRLAEILKQHPDIELDAIGHTCDIGTVEQNKIVGMRRAEAVKAELTKRGVSSKQIHCITKWFTEPLYPNNSEENRAKNRRYELRQK